MNKVKQKYSVKKDVSSYRFTDLLKEIEEDRDILQSLGCDMEKKTYTPSLSIDSRSTMGRCSWTSVCPNNYLIQVNPEYVKKCKAEEIHTTIMHEVIHSVDGCGNHGPEWKRIAALVNANYQFLPITRTSGYEDWVKILRDSSKYFATCKKCGYTYTWVRRGRAYDLCVRNRAKCSLCGGDRFICKENKTT